MTKKPPKRAVKRPDPRLAETDPSTGPEAIAERERSLAWRASALEIISEAVISTDAALKIRTWSPGAAQIYGWREGEVAGTSLAQIFRGDWLDERRQHCLRSLTARAGWSGDEIHRRKDGAPIEVRVASAVASTAEGVIGFVLAVRDLSEIRLLERQVRQLQKSETIGHLSSGIAHDFNNALMSIIGCTDVALRQLGDAPIRGHLYSIREAATAASSVSKRILSFSRPRADEVAVFDLHGLIRRTVSLLKPILGEHVQISLGLRATAPRLRADQNHLEQALTNLVVNARDAMPDGGHLAIETHDLDRPPDEALGVPLGPCISLTVHDTGSGMDALTLGRAFEAFFTTKPVGRGSGLGLFIVRELLERSGGHISLTSEPGAGTTARIIFTRTSDAASTAPRGRVPSQAAKHGGTILVVEDDRLVRLALRCYLEDAGYQMLEASDGAGAIDLAIRHDGPIDLLLTDMLLPGRQGHQIAPEVATIRPGIPVVFLSAHSRERLIDLGRLDPSADSLEKPVSPEELVAKIEEVLARARRDGAAREPKAG